MSRSRAQARIWVWSKAKGGGWAIKDLGSAFGLYVLAFRDPDNIQLELSAPA